MIYVDNTILSAMARCTTKGILRYGLGMTTDEEFATFKCGQAWHSSMDVYLRGNGAERALLTFTNEYADWADAHVPLGHRLEYDNVANILEQWLADHPLDALPYEVPSPDFVEVGFAFPLAKDIMYTGRFDAAVTMRGTDDWYVLDHKTTGYINQDRVNKYQLDSQMSGYIWALQQQVPEHVAGAIINMIELKKLPSDRKRKCKKHGVVYAECGHLHGESQLFIVERTPEQIEQWKRTAIRLAKEYQAWMYPYLFERDGITLEDVPSLPIEGAFNGSCEWCEFSQLCTMGKPLDMLRSNLIHSPWSPWPALEDDDGVSE